MFHNQPALFEDPHIVDPIDNLDLPFADYITQYRQILAQTRQDLQKNPGSTEANLPYDLRPTGEPSTGVLLLHGLLDSPFIMKDVGRHFQQNGILARAILLPGHGTVPGALLNVPYEQWLQALRYGIATLKKEVERIFLVGFSTGASAALYHTLTEQDPRIAGLILICPALRIRSFFDFTSGWHRFLFPHSKRMAWANVASDEMMDYVKYRSIAFNGVHQLYRLYLAIKAHPDKPRCPLFFCVSQNDATVNADTSIDYFKRKASSDSRMLIYTTEPTKDDGRIFYRNAVYPEQHIVSASHLSPPTSPDNPHYGKNGDFPLASRVDEMKNTLFGEFDDLSLQINQLLYQHHLTPMLKMRLTYNPDFHYFANMALQFIKENE